MAVRRIVHVLTLALAVVGASATQKAEAQNWDGSGLIRFGVFLQGSFIDYDIHNRNTAANTILNQSASPSGVGVGIASGYDLRFGNFLVGAEADLSFDDGRSKARPLTQEQYGIDFFATLRGRLGYYVAPGFLVYGTAGLALLGAEYKLNGTPVGAATGPGIKKYGTLDGFVYGGGMEYDLGLGIGFLEYLHSDVGGWDFQSLRPGNQISLDGQQDVVRIGLKFKVGHDFTHDVYRRPDGLK